MKLPYCPKIKCFHHPDEVAAICSACYDIALKHQGRQRKEEQEKEHQKYLDRLEMAHI